MQRKLCPVETIYVAQRSRAVLSCTVRGDIDEKLLAAAFAAKVAEHPSLRCRIAVEDGAAVLEPLAEAEVPALLVRDGGPDAFIEEFSIPLPVGGPLVRAVLLRGESEHTVMLSVDHTVTDGHSGIALQNALWETYTALAEGTSVEAAAEWPSPVSELLPPASEQETEDYLARRIERARQHPVTCLPYDAAGTEPESPELAVQRVLLGPGETNRLLRSAKAEGVSVHGFVGAAMLKAVRHRLDGDPGPRSLGCMSPVDLRSRLTPPLAREVMVPAVTSCLDVLEVSHDTDPLALARQITDNLHTALDRGEYLHEMRLLPRVPEHPALLATSVIVTNMGRVAGPVTPPGLEVVDVRLVPARENYFPQAGRGPLMSCVTTFDGRIAIELPYSTACFTHRQMSEIRDSLHATLLGFSAHRGDAEGAVAVPA
ncbi:phthiocerol/phthiodiolone dimycocerosyl transferase family protein [Streptomyces sp. CBMA152]|uniref:phthiocerol/phthiodiolone dimycocerosyl transferase family protein n=1 Tax=Streptomyces sp. CBMA152 TaxID=1896312 RepID=UPI001CB75B7A|nr:condensation domain-containing protein [Streptomyces sp. CBMA152]MBD0746799.1 protein kinase [Streptomyces sp. CBMA152]